MSPSMALPTPPSPAPGSEQALAGQAHSRGSAEISRSQAGQEAHAQPCTHTHTHGVMSEGAVCQQHILQHFSLLANQLLKEELPAPGQLSPPARLSCAAEEGSGLGTAAALRGALSAPSFIIH